MVLCSIIKKIGQTEKYEFVELLSMKIEYRKADIADAELLIDLKLEVGYERNTINRKDRRILKRR